MTDPVYLDDRLSRAVDALFFATGENMRALRDTTTRQAALDNISALWATFDDADLAVLHRFVRYWNDDRAGFICNLISQQPEPARAAAFEALNTDDRNRVIAYSLFTAYPPAHWRAADHEAAGDPAAARAVRENIAAGHVQPKPWDR
jgi:hypothetical protein